MTGAAGRGLPEASAKASGPHIGMFLPQRRGDTEKCDEKAKRFALDLVTIRKNDLVGAEGFTRDSNRHG